MSEYEFSLTRIFPYFPLFWFILGSDKGIVNCLGKSALANEKPYLV